MSVIDFTPEIVFSDESNSHTHSKPVLNCSTIKAKLYNTILTKANKTFEYNDTDVLVQWYNGFCDWIKINDEYFDNKYIPIDLLSQIAEFMIDTNNYTLCNDCHH
jgi:hypothetical protein